MTLMTRPEITISLDGAPETIDALLDALPDALLDVAEVAEVEQHLTGRIRRRPITVVTLRVRERL